MKLTNIASLDPAITSSGRKGLSGASLADRKMWGEMQNDWESFALESESALGEIMQHESGFDTPPFNGGDRDDYSGLERDVKIKARVGQDFFRRSVLSAYNYKCCMTGLAVPKLLVASHIVPWRSDPLNRLNPKNGLSLSMLHDKAFDLGMITISDDMRIKVSDVKNSESDHFFQIALKGYENKRIALPEKFSPLEEFLNYHREHIFQR